MSAFPARPPGVRDADLLRALAALEPSDTYRHDARARARIDISMAAYRTLFRMFCAELDAFLNGCPPAFDAFLAWLPRQRIPLDWTLYLSFMRWLRQSSFAPAASDALADAALAAAASHWISMDRSDASGIVLARYASSDWIVGWKCRSLAGRGSVEKITVDTHLPTTPGVFGFFLVAGSELDSFPGWRLPHH